MMLPLLFFAIIVTVNVVTFHKFFYLKSAQQALGTLGWLLLLFGNVLPQVWLWANMVKDRQGVLLLGALLCLLLARCAVELGRLAEIAVNQENARSAEE